MYDAYHNGDDDVAVAVPINAFSLVKTPFLNYYSHSTCIDIYICNVWLLACVQ